MPQFLWDEKYDVGIKHFNQQHKQLLDAIRDVYKAMEDKQDRVAIANVINNLIKYAKEHLSEEEACLLNNKYPDYMNHKKQHEFFIEKISKFCDDFKSENFMLHFEIAVFLKNWIVNHIMVIDTQYTDFLNSKGVY